MEKSVIRAVRGVGGAYTVCVGVVALQRWHVKPIVMLSSLKAAILRTFYLEESSEEETEKHRMRIRKMLHFVLWNLFSSKTRITAVKGNFLP